MNLLWLLLGFAILFAGGEFLVKGAAGLAIRAKIPPMIVGLTVVSLGTSAPELFAGLQAASMGKADISIGTVVGSNIANLGLVLGITVLIFPLPVNRAVLKTDWPMMIFATFMFLFLGWDGILSFFDGIILLLTLFAFMAFLVYRSYGKADVLAVKEAEELKKSASFHYLTLFSFIALGGIGLYMGSEWFLRGAIGMAEQFGVSDHVIGVTVVAFGTSVPELAASGIAAFRRQTDISLGNLIGSNIFNILGVLGVTSVAADLNVAQEVLNWDFIWMLGVALILFPFIFFGKKISRWNGMVLLLIYLAYVFLLLS